MISKKIIAFDFDGVIVDSLHLSYSINQDLMPDLDYDDWCTWSEGNFHEVVRNRKDIQFLFNDKNYEYFRDKYDSGVLEINPTNGIKNILDRLQGEYTLVVISSNSEKPIEAYLKRYNLLDYFQELLGEETHKSKVAKFQLLMDKYKIVNDDILLITDSLGDIKEANELNIKSLAVLWGVHDKGTLSKANPHSIVASPQDLLNAMESILK